MHVSNSICEGLFMQLLFQKASDESPVRTPCPQPMPEMPTCDVAMWCLTRRQIYMGLIQERTLSTVLCVKQPFLGNSASWNSHKSETAPL